MSPDYGDALFWDEDNICIGELDYIEIGKKEIDITAIDGLRNWYKKWEAESLFYPNDWTNSEWLEWWRIGLELARMIKTQLPANVELYYFQITENVWRILPQDTNDGGVFDEIEPIHIK